MPRIARFIPVVLTALLAVGCDSSSTGPNSLAGTYALILINGESLPFVVETEDGDVEILSGQFTVNQAGTCNGGLTFRDVGTDDVQMIGNTCTWTRTGSQFEVHWSDGATDVGTIQGARISLVAQDLGDLLLVFEK